MTPRKLSGERYCAYPEQGMTWHMADNGRRMYRCQCMPGFRNGSRVYLPRRLRGGIRGGVSR